MFPMKPTEIAPNRRQCSLGEPQTPRTRQAWRAFAYFEISPEDIIPTLSLLFRQTRIGLDGKPFTLYKLKTMRDPRPGEDPLATDAVRITRFGRFLRATSLDELPTLWNVLKGDMTLVGPRPLLPEYLPLYTPEQMRRHEVKPGITGWAQVNGRNAIGWEERLRLDAWYVDNRTAWLDLKILWLTLWKVLRREGISADGHATMAPFRGSGERGDVQ
jgi:lipopolysaccharide/colanic/teichoic acid biosynthesis glycosyltransferase